MTDTRLRQSTNTVENKEEESQQQQTVSEVSATKSGCPTFSFAWTARTDLQTWQ